MRRIFLFWIGLIILNAVVAQTDSVVEYKSLSNQELVQKYAGRGSFDICRTADTIFVDMHEGVNVENTQVEKNHGFYRDRYTVTYHVFTQKNHDYLAKSIAMYAKRCRVSPYFGFNSALFDGVYAGDKFERMSFRIPQNKNGYFTIEVRSKKEFDFYNMFIWIADELDYVNIDSAGKERMLFDGTPGTLFNRVVGSTTNKTYSIPLSEQERDSINYTIRNNLIQQIKMTDQYSNIVEALAFSTLNLTDIEALFLNIDTTGKIGESYYFSKAKNNYQYFDAVVFANLRFPVLIENKNASEYCVRFRSDAIDLAIKNRLFQLFQDTNVTKPIFPFNNKIFLIHSTHDKLYFLCDTGRYRGAFRYVEYFENIVNRIAEFSDSIPRSAFYTDLNRDGRNDFVFQNGNQFSYPQKTKQDWDYLSKITVFYNVDNPDTCGYARFIAQYGQTFISPVFSKDSAYIFSSLPGYTWEVGEDRFVYCFTEKGDSIVLGYERSCSESGTFIPCSRKYRSVFLFDGRYDQNGKPKSTEISGRKNSRKVIREYNKRIDKLMKK